MNWDKGSKFQETYTVMIAPAAGVSTANGQTNVTIQGFITNVLIESIICEIEMKDLVTNLYFGRGDMNWLCAVYCGSTAQDVTCLIDQSRLGVPNFGAFNKEIILSDQWAADTPNYGFKNLKDLILSVDVYFKAMTVNACQGFAHIRIQGVYM